jgi:hypothetical protein
MYRPGVAGPAPPEPSPTSPAFYKFPPWPSSEALGPSPRALAVRPAPQRPALSESPGPWRRLGFPRTFPLQGSCDAPLQPCQSRDLSSKPGTASRFCSAPSSSSSPPSTSPSPRWSPPPRPSQPRPSQAYPALPCLPRPTPNNRSTISRVSICYVRCLICLK